LKGELKEMNHMMLDALNQQINEEMYSAYLYLSMVAYFHSMKMPGAAHWMVAQYKEELMHAEKIIAYIMDRGANFKLREIKEPTNHWSSPIDAFKAAYAHEQHITGCITNLYDIAMREKDYPTVQFLQWFVNEQVEEEANASQIVDDFERIGHDARGLFMLDRELASRPMPAPAPASKE
jgi:ferritin